MYNRPNIFKLRDVEKFNIDYIYASINYPRRLYIFQGNNSWTSVARKNGLKKKDIYSLG